MSKEIITISREFGSGGRLIGEKLAKRLGIAFYDKEIIERVAEKTGFAKEFIEKRGEYSNYKNFFSYAFSGRTRTGMSVDDIMVVEQSKLIREIADKEPCVIVGRCADNILRDREDALHVFIGGNTPEKLRRVMELYGVDKETAAAQLKQMDKKRAINYQYCTDRKWGRRENYDICLNSSTLGYEKCIDILEELAKE